MIGNYFRTDEITIRKIQKGETSLFELLYPDSGFSQLQESEIFEVDEDCFLNVDQAWHVIHFVLSGKVWETTDDPLSKVVLSGNFINDENLGYGPAQFITPKEVQSASKALKTVTKDWFRKRFSTSDMLLANDIYPIRHGTDEEIFFNYVYELFEDVVVFFKQAANNGQYILFFVN